MKISKAIVECPKNEKKFTCVEYEFSHQSNTADKKLLDSLAKDGEKLANSVNPTLARDASRRRRYETVKVNCIAGIIAEYCWRHWLNSEAKRLGVKVSAKSKVFQSIDKHVDISIIYSDNTSTVEVRSSFPYAGLQNAICRFFDIIGWYVNPIKIKEIRKDYYTRVLYPFHASLLYHKLKSESFSAFLAGGATRVLLEKSPYSRNKIFVPYYDIDAMSSSQLGEYHVIEPIINAYDTPEITQHILKGTQ